MDKKQILKTLLLSHENIKTYVDGCRIETPEDMFFFLESLDNHEIEIIGFDINYYHFNTLMTIEIKTELPNYQLPF